MAGRRRHIAAVTTYRAVFDGMPKPGAQAPRSRVQRVARLLALAHDVDRRIREGELRDLAHAAEELDLTRARLTQVMNLLLLAPQIQEEILSLPRNSGGRDQVTERMLRPIVAESDWDKQIAMWRKLHG